MPRRQRFFPLREPPETTNAKLLDACIEARKMLKSVNETGCAKGEIGMESDIIEYLGEVIFEARKTW
jgi:hypothetical protein